MDVCRRCGSELPGGAKFCPCCGKAVEQSRATKKRGNGQGSVYKLPNGKYKASVTLGYYLGEDGKRHRRARTQVFEKKKDAVAALPTLATSPARERKKAMTFKALYDLWIPTHRAGRAAIASYKAAIRYYQDVWHMQLDEIEIEDLQECIDSCPRGKSTRENMKTAARLMYNYGIPRHLVPGNLNLAQFISVGGEDAFHSTSFTEDQVELIRNAVGIVPYADYIYCMIYTGFRQGEFLALTPESYDPERDLLIGGSKTEAGKNRIVTISPKIKPFLLARLALGHPYIFSGEDGRHLTHTYFMERCFYPALEQIGIDNPLVDLPGGTKRHKYTPHACRRTFATLMKAVDGAEKDKMELIGHANLEMLRYYQDVSVEDLKRITDSI